MISGRLPAIRLYNTGQNIFNNSISILLKTPECKHFLLLLILESHELSVNCSGSAQDVGIYRTISNKRSLRSPFCLVFPPDLKYDMLIFSTKEG